MEQALNVKDFLVNIDLGEQEEKARRAYNPKPTIYKTILQNNTDFVINRKTSTTDKTLAFLISQDTYYVKDNKTEKAEYLTQKLFRSFFQPIWDIDIKEDYLSQVEWWKRTPQSMEHLVNHMLENPTLCKMYRYGIFASYNEFDIQKWRERFLANPKLFKYCYDQVKQSRVNTRHANEMLRAAFLINKHLDYNNAKLFIDKFCESNVKFNLGDYYYDDERKESPFYKFVKIIEDYSLEFCRFIEYISQNLYSQGIAEFNNDMLTTYIDYLRMQIGLYGKVREKYSKHLKTDHDKISLKNSEYSKHKQDLLMFNIAEYQRKLEYRSGKYIIRIPETSMEVVDEGVDLCHCVASYVEDIVKGQTLIVFLRDKNEPDESLVTIEVCNEEIKQVQGFCRRLPHEDENLFIKEWAKKKNLICNYPGRIEE